MFRRIKNTLKVRSNHSSGNMAGGLPWLGGLYHLEREGDEGERNKGEEVK